MTGAGTEKEWVFLEELAVGPELDLLKIVFADEALTYQALPVAPYKSSATHASLTGYDSYKIYVPADESERAADLLKKVRESRPAQ
ncbi:MAG: hypothetical protein AB7P04_12875 [Bacteriovoracia bacterium]